MKKLATAAFPFLLLACGEAGQHADESLEAIEVTEKEVTSAKPTKTAPAPVEYNPSEVQARLASANAAALLEEGSNPREKIEDLLRKCRATPGHRAKQALIASIVAEIKRLPEAEWDRLVQRLREAAGPGWSIE